MKGALLVAALLVAASAAPGAAGQAKPRSAAPGAAERGAAEPGAPAVRAYLRRMRAVQARYDTAFARGEAAAAATEAAVWRALGGDRTELVRVVASLRATAADLRRIAAAAAAVRPPRGVKHPQYVRSVRLVARVHGLSAQLLERLDNSRSAEVGALGARARVDARAWRASVIAAARRAGVPVPAWVRRVAA